MDVFVRWIKQHLRGKAFFGTIENAVKSLIGNAVSVYALVAIVRKRLTVSRSLDELLQMWRLNELEEMPLDMLFSRGAQAPDGRQPDNQLILFE